MFSIVTVNYNGERFLKNFFDSLVNQSYKDFNLCFIDNGSKDNSVKLAEGYRELINLRVITLDKNYGFAKANNIGIDECMKDNNQYIITLNNDIELEKDCLKNLYTAINKTKGKYDVFQIFMLNYYERNTIDAAGMNFSKHYFPIQVGYKEDISNAVNLKSDISGACAGAAVYSKNALNSIKDKNGDYFDSEFFAYYEDVDLALRILNKGFKTLLIKEAVVYHIHSGTTSVNSTFKTYYLARNLLFYLKKNLSEKIYKKNRPFYMYYFFRILIQFLIQGKFAMFATTIKGYFNYKTKIEPFLKDKKVT